MDYRRFLVLGTTVALTALVACSSDEGEPPTGSAGANSVAGCEGRGEQFSAGMSKESEGGAIKVVLKKADVAPPAQGLNTWTFEITDASGQPIAGADVEASSRMPDHPHAPTKKTGSETEPGVYEVVPYFSMPGYWETTITVTPAGGTAGSVMFSFCIEQD